VAIKEDLVESTAHKQQGEEGDETRQYEELLEVNTEIAQKSPGDKPKVPCTASVSDGVQ
jgi:hypothetical protein